MSKWNFIYDEEIPDEYPNFMGIISNGKDVLFYHGLTTDPEKEEETFEIYASFTEMFMSGEKVISFPWTAENEEKFINFLNSLPEDADFYSDSSDLLNFNPDEEK